MNRSLLAVVPLYVLVCLSPCRVAYCHHPGQSCSCDTVCVLSVSCEALLKRQPLCIVVALARNIFSSFCHSVVLSLLPGLVVSCCSVVGRSPRGVRFRSLVRTSLPLPVCTQQTCLFPSSGLSSLGVQSWVLAWTTWVRVPAGPEFLLN